MCGGHPLLVEFGCLFFMLFLAFAPNVTVYTKSKGFTLPTSLFTLTKLFFISLILLLFAQLQDALAPILLFNGLYLSSPFTVSAKLLLLIFATIFLAGARFSLLHADFSAR